jgi:hypothetical protein
LDDSLDRLLDRDRQSESGQGVVHDSRSTQGALAKGVLSALASFRMKT